MSCAKLTIVRLELSIELLVPHQFACHSIIFCQRQTANAVSEECSEKFNKSTQKTLCWSTFLVTLRGPKT